MYPIESETRKAVQFIEKLVSAPASVLELGIGTGRVAIPLMERGYKVHGIDSSEAMLNRLKERDPESSICAILGDFTADKAGREYDVIMLVLSTFFVAVTKEQQLSCLRLVCDQLAPGGHFLLEAFDPAPYHGLRKPDTSFRCLSDGMVMLDSATVDHSRQLMEVTHTIIDGGSPTTMQHTLRYAFPAEIDLLAELSGLRLVGRFGDWSRQPYSRDSLRHVSIYERADDKPQDPALRAPQGTFAS